MSSIDRSRRSNRGTGRTAGTVLAAATAVLALLATSACGPDNSPEAGDAAAAASAGASLLGLPANLDDLKKWKSEDWEKWAKQDAIPAAAKGFWTIEKLLAAKPATPGKANLPDPGPATQAPATQAPASQAPTASKAPASQAPTQAPATKAPATQAPASQAPTQAPATKAPASQAPATQAPATQAPATKAPATKAANDNGNDPAPQMIKAEALPHPYSKYMFEGRLFAVHPDGTGGSCSATVVSDPAHPGKSNLVWTAGHCVTSDGAYDKEITFIPGYNSTGAASGKKTPTKEQSEPLGEFPMTEVLTTPQWKSFKSHLSGVGSHYDYAIVRVAPADNGKSLEETVGGSVPVWFNAPREQLAPTSYGYPAAAPFDGQELNRCVGSTATRVSWDPARPPLIAIGCTMTPGSSGGGWLALRDGKPALVSDNAACDCEESGGAWKTTWMAGPYLDDQAAGMLDFMAKRS
ncbi:hypothetical protein [Streptomyces sp. CB01881]|uniref:trypsin-like serine peptidase n=1 Tax=Streptomyces sp. CB01881 TaxID=2078691 RepID=UPI000CDC66F8|nr:hypothetical protein [Streptomyces sp. CB01881]AUY49523.1 hypothetical protein C2142_11885 [Streptomyces sp. CB01881]TYC72912.1 hypothetical protein EH183_11890 [Streptomyces sp. CB01881]